MTATAWELLLQRPSFRLSRHGRFVVAELLEPHRVLSTSARNGGQTDSVRYLLNHQSCEGAGHGERHAAVMANGEAAYHDAVCHEAAIPPELAVTMGTAANMNYSTVASETDGDVEVTAVVTAGVQ